MAPNLGSGDSRSKPFKKEPKVSTNVRLALENFEYSLLGEREKSIFFLFLRRSASGVIRLCLVREIFWIFGTVVISLLFDN